MGPTTGASTSCSTYDVQRPLEPSLRRSVRQLADNSRQVGQPVGRQAERCSRYGETPSRMSIAMFQKSNLDKHLSIHHPPCPFEHSTSLNRRMLPNSCRADSRMALEGSQKQGEPRSTRKRQGEPLGNPQKDVMTVRFELTPRRTSVTR